MVDSEEAVHPSAHNGHNRQSRSHTAETNLECDRKVISRLQCAGKEESANLDSSRMILPLVQTSDPSEKPQLPESPCIDPTSSADVITMGSQACSMRPLSKVVASLAMLADSPVACEARQSLAPFQRFYFASPLA